MGRKKREKVYSEKIHVRVTDDMHQEIEKIARKMRISKCALIRQAVDFYLSYLSMKQVIYR